MRNYNRYSHLADDKEANNSFTVKKWLFIYLKIYSNFKIIFYVYT